MAEIGITFIEEIYKLQDKQGKISYRSVAIPLINQVDNKISIDGFSEDLKKTVFSLIFRIDDTTHEIDSYDFIRTTDLSETRNYKFIDLLDAIKKGYNSSNFEEEFRVQRNVITSLKKPDDVSEKELIEFPDLLSEKFTDINRDEKYSLLDVDSMDRKYKDLLEFYDRIDLVDVPIQENIESSSRLIGSDLFLTTIFEILFQEPIIVKEFFSVELGSKQKEYEEYNIENIYFDASEMSLRLNRVESIFGKSSILNPANKNLAEKTEGIFAYLNKSTRLSTIKKVMDGENPFFAYIPVVKYRNNEEYEEGDEIRINFLANRKVAFNFKTLVDSSVLKNISTYCKSDELGWIFPHAYNVTRADKHADNRLLFHWAGDSLGVEAPLESMEDVEDKYIEKEDESLGKKVSDFIKKYIYDKEIDIPSEQPSLKDDMFYEFGLIPISITGDFPVYNKSGIEVSLKNLLLDKNKNFPNLNLFKTKKFRVLDVINSPEVISKGWKQCSSDTNEAQIILQHPLNKKRQGKLIEEFVILPPKVDFNVARWLGVFETNCEDDFKNAYKWIKKLDNPIPETWKKNLNEGIPYVFDKRIIEKKLHISIREKVFPLQEEDYPYIPISRGNQAPENGKGNDKIKIDNGNNLNDVKPIFFKIESVSATEISSLINPQDNKVVLRIPEGKELSINLIYEYDFYNPNFKNNPNNNSNPTKIIKVINAVPKLLLSDFKTIPKIKTILIRRKFGEKSPQYVISIMIDNINYNIAEYFYLFRRYLRVNPMEWDALPTRSSLLANRRISNTLTKEIINIETDKAIFKKDSKGEGTKKRRNKSEKKSYESFVFHPNNVFQLKEVFGEKRVEILKPIDDGFSENLVIDNKIGFGKLSGIDKFNFSAHFNGDQRAKEMDYINLKLYSKHLHHYREKRVEKLLLGLDYNISIESSEKERVEMLLEDTFPASGLISNVSPPMFATKLLFLNEKVNQEGLNIKRKTLLMLLFDKDELNVLSDNDFIGIDFSKDEKSVGDVKIISNKTDLGVDFTIQNEKRGSFDIKSLCSPIGLNRENGRLNFSFQEGKSDFEEKIEDINNNIVFFKPYYLYEENKGFVLLDLSKFLDGIELDPFLKISLCQGYQTSTKEWKRSKTSKPQYIQLSSNRDIHILTTVNSIEINLNSNFEGNTMKLRTQYFIAFYEKDKSPFSSPLLLKYEEEGIKKEQRYILLSDDSNMKELIIKDENKYTIAQNSKIEVYRRSQKESFNPVNFQIKIFEFNKYDNLQEELFEGLIKETDFNPFNNSYFKLVFSC